jgi:hypothetical protein
MPIKKQKQKRKRAATSRSLNKPQGKSKKFVKVTNRSYGNALKGTKIYYEGKRPSGLGPDGRISFGKHILEMLTRKFGKKFRWIITENIDGLTIERKIARVRTSKPLLDRMSSENIDRNRDIKNDIVARTFSTVFPTQFTQPPTAAYVPGTLVKVLSPGVVSRLSSQDREAVNAILPEYLKSESTASVNLLKAAAQIESLKDLAQELETAISATHGESWWQTYIRSKILIIQQGYIKAIEKMNVVIGTTKFPDFALVTHDNYLDILEIKKPDTTLLRLDPSRNNYYWDLEPAKAIIQVENYISSITENSNAVRSYILDNEKLNLKVVRPRGILLAGNAKNFNEQKERDDFRLLSQGLKNITVVTYDELLTRLKNYIEVLEEYRQMK